MMVPILIVSVVALTIVIEKWFTLSRLRKPSPAFLISIFEAIRQHDWELALGRSRALKHPLARILEIGLLEATKESSDFRTIEESMKLKGDEIIHKMDESLKMLGSLITILPWLGFLGTIVGLIVAFQRWEILGASVTIAQLSSGIYQAMITTAAALMFVIPYFLAHQHLSSKVGNIALELSRFATEFLSRLRSSLIDSGKQKLSALTSKSISKRVTTTHV